MGRAVRGDRGVPVELAGAAATAVFRLGGIYLRFLAKRRRSVRAFERSLVAEGMPRARALQLAQAYDEAGSLRRLLVRVGGRLGRRSPNR